MFTGPDLREDQIGKYYPDSYGAYSFKGKVKSLFEKISRQPKVHNRLTDLLEQYRVNLAKELETKFPASCWYRIYNIVIAHYFNFQRKQPVKYYAKMPKSSHPKRFLHLGSGHPVNFAQYMFHDGYEVHNIDINQSLCDEYNEVGVLSNCATISSTEYPDNYFDYMYAGHVIEHFFHPGKELRKLHSWLKKDGVFVCSFPLYGTAEFSYKTSFFDPPRHRIHLTRKTAKMLFKDAGFRIWKISFPPYGWGLQQNAACHDFFNDSDFDNERWQQPLSEKYYWMSYLLSLIRQSGNPVYYLRK